MTSLIQISQTFHAFYFLPYRGPLEERKASDMLFVDLGDDGGEASHIDLASEECTLEYTVDEVPEGGGKIKLKSRKVKLKTPKLKSHQFIKGLPGAKPPRKARKEGTLTVSMKKKNELQSKDPKKIKNRKEAMKQMLGDFQRTLIRPKSLIKADYSKDLWEDGADEVTQECKKKGLEESFIGAISDYYRRERKIKPIKVPKIRHVPTSKLNAVRIPNAGASYNPSYQSHQKLLFKAVNQEQKYLKQVNKVNKATTKMFPTIDKAPTHESWLVEMSEGLPTANEEEETEEADNNHQKQEALDDNITFSCKPMTERKPKKIRRKERKQELQKMKKLKQKEDRIRDSSIYKLKTFQKEIVEEELMADKRTISRLALRERHKFMPHRLANMKFEEEDIEVKLGDELTESLRTVTPAVELLEERFKSMQRRNILEPRLKHKMKRIYKQKIVLKRTHREELAKITKMELDE
ncbi:Ribosome biogenesis protein NOP53 [Chionoecetes opilio]|uniref:Ribosome biogenesis protein NOP53 n=1 Tax=Chionoecetes opilio TaxID=41210 RepID=A0A8J4XXU6_CHIOP|nr:Ribosome biogenesis protein NOP53 [Chionoecetes opilio]